MAAVTDAAAAPEKWLLIGKNGWLGGMLIELLKAGGKDFVLANSRTQNRERFLDRDLRLIRVGHGLTACGTRARRRGILKCSGGGPVRSTPAK